MKPVKAAIRRAFNNSVASRQLGNHISKGQKISGRGSCSSIIRPIENIENLKSLGFFFWLHLCCLMILNNLGTCPKMKKKSVLQKTSHCSLCILYVFLACVCVFDAPFEYMLAFSSSFPFTKFHTMQAGIFVGILWILFQTDLLFAPVICSVILLLYFNIFSKSTSWIGEQDG